MKRPENLIYSVDEWPPWPRLALLGLQQVSVISIYLMLLVVVLRKAGAAQEMAQNTVSLSMIALGIGAMLQAIWRGPVGSGYLAPPVLSAIYLQPSIVAAKVAGLPLVFGMTILAGLFESLLSRFLHRLRKVFPPVVCGVIVAAVGFDVGLIGIADLLDVAGEQGTTSFTTHIAVAVLTLMTMIGFSVWGSGMLRLLCSLLGIIIGIIVAAPAGLIPSERLQQLVAAPVFALPSPDHIAYAFDLSLVLPFLLAALAAGLRVIGVVTTCQQINDAEWKHPDITSIKGGVLADGLGCIFSGLLGSIGLSSAPSAVGVAKASGATSRHIAFAVGAWFVGLACFPKVAAAFLALPVSVVGAGFVFTGSFMIVGGIQIIAAQAMDTRKTLIVGVSILLALSHKLFPAYFQALPSWLHPMTGSILTMATLSAVLLNLLFRLGIRRSAAMIVQINQTQGEDIDHFLQREGKNLGVSAYGAERASTVTKEVLELIRERALADGPVTLKISFDEIDLVLDITYQGSLLHLPPHRPLPKELIEELPFSLGLSGFLLGVYPDRVVSQARDAYCHIRLIFQA